MDLDPLEDAAGADDELRVGLPRDPRLGIGPLDGFGNARECVVDGSKRDATRLDRQVGQVEVHRESRHVANEEVDRRPTLEREAPLGRDVRQDAEQQVDLRG